MTSDPSSVLADQGIETSPFIASLALRLVREAREEGLEIREVPKERKEKKQDRDAAGEHGKPTATLSKSSERDVTSSLNRALAAEEATARKATKARMPSFTSPMLGSPLFGSFLTQQQRKPVSGLEAAQKLPPGPQDSPLQGGAPAAVPAQAVTRKAASVPLESIIPHTAKPPTEYLSRTYTPLTARDFRASIPLPHSASRFSVYHGDTDQEPLTDRFGFMYDVSQYDVLLLVRAKECGNAAPACLTGVKIADRTEDNDWSDDEVEVEVAMEVVKEACDCDGELAVAEARGRHPSLRSVPTTDSSGASLASRGVSPSSSRASRPRSSTVTSSATAAASSAGQGQARARSSILAFDADAPRHVCANVIRRLLEDLTRVHDQRQAAQRKEWDAFVRLRRRARAAPVAKASTSASVSAAAVAGGAAAILGLGTAVAEDELSHSEGLIGFAQLGLSANKDERRELGRLVQSGIPLVYRAKVWLECSGGLEMREPGLFRDLLAEVGADEGVLREIEKDVGRTMPLNVFFGGDGAGVDKLRRVLTAYSR